MAAFVATLGYSRYVYVEFVTHKMIETLKACHVNAFEWFEDHKIGEQVTPITMYEASN